MSNILEFPTEFKGINEPQRPPEEGEALKLYPTIDTLVFVDDEAGMSEAIVSTKHVDILVIYDEEEDDYYIKAGNMLTHAETKKEANDLLRDIMQSLKKI